MSEVERGHFFRKTSTHYHFRLGGFEISLLRSRRRLARAVDRMREKNRLLREHNDLLVRDRSWDLVTLAKNRENCEAVLSLKNQYEGKRCFVVGNSPSVAALDLAKLADECVFTVGRGYRLRRHGLRRSTFHVLSDYYGYREFRDEIDPAFSDIFFVSSNVPFDIDGPRRVFFDYYFPFGNEFVFQDDLAKPLAACQTVIGFALPIAYYLGFKEIVLIGVDLDFAKVGGHAYDDSEREKHSQLTHSRQNQEIMLAGLAGAVEFLTANGVTIVNASPAGALDCMPRKKFSELV